MELWERQLLINVFSKMPPEFHYLCDQVEEGILKRVFFISTPIPNYVGFSYNRDVVGKFERKQDNGFEIKGVRVYDEVSKSFIDFEIHISHGLVIGYSTPNNKKISIDINKIDVSDLKIQYDINPLYDKIRPLLKPAYVRSVSPDDVYEVELDGKIYYHLQDLEDGDFIGMDDNGKYYEITHDPYEIKEIS
ncbi:hypothetical protein [Chitinophaga terrae (ex Kim and Jung 2007)]|uniref:hypothetical protein n=1 Tax=Chitinophaga terrae (ex Kim and Jung 2007) TaxID=408074 RepID=UPI0027D79826|nr:hypothetical protein [Chitinophaga terrae (ex Kim and Jung 2007)]